jgi:hypothetical protein
MYKRILGDSAAKMFHSCRHTRASVVGFAYFIGSEICSLAGVTFNNFENGTEYGFARGATDQETVQIRKSD